MRGRCFRRESAAPSAKCGFPRATASIEGATAGMSEYSAEAAEAEQLVARATAETLAGPDWALNMAVCDLANSQALVCDDIVRLLQRRLQSGSPRATLLALVLAETVVKNGPPAVHAQVGSRAFLNEVAALTDGGMGFDVQNHALVLIKQWADAFSGSTLTAFQDTYRQLKLQGIVFPDVENDAPVFTPPTSTNAAGASRPATRGDAAGSAAASAGAGSGMTRREQQIAKLHADLKVVMEKISQLRSLTSRGDGGEDLENVLDFLHQCQPRMNTLIEGGIMGKIDERTLEECLNVNDNLIKALEESRAAGRTGNLLHLDSPPTGACDIGSDFQRMSLGSRQTSSAAGSTLTSMDDDFNSFLNNRTG